MTQRRKDQTNNKWGKEKITKILTNANKNKWTNKWITTSEWIKWMKERKRMTELTCKQKPSEQMKNKRTNKKNGKERKNNDKHK